MKKRKFLVQTIICFLLLSVCHANATDVGNSTGSSGSIPGAASVGSAAYGANYNWTMWKISVYVGKDSKTAKTESEIENLSFDSLSDDYYQFGKTFWLYRDARSIYCRKGIRTEELKKRFWLATNNKEQYINEMNDIINKGLSPGGLLSFNMSSADSLESRIFCAGDIDFETDIIGGATMPYVRNIGNVDGMIGEDYDEQVDIFFNQSKHNWNMLINLAGIAAGKSGENAYKSLLLEMVNDGLFTTNETTITDLSQVSPYRSLDANGKYVKESSVVAWVIVYEPVIIFYKVIDGDYNYFAMTASDASASFISGELNLTNRSGFSSRTCINESSFSTLKTNKLYPWNFASPFFINLAESVLPKSNWFGYELLTEQDYSNEKYDECNYLYVDSVLKKCGVGFRYQASNAVSEGGTCDLTCEIIQPVSPYKAGLEVVTSAYVYNNGTIDIIPNINNTVSFNVSLSEADNNETIVHLEKSCVVIPQNEKNLVYFKWKVPDNLEGKQITITITVDANSSISESDEKNNTNILSICIAKIEYSKTPNTCYEDETPSDFRNMNSPLEYTETATWEQWEYLSGEFYKNKYGITYGSKTGVEIDVEQGNVSAVYDAATKKWTIKSGYGFYVKCYGDYVNVKDYLLPSEDSYTGVQVLLSLFPEYNYAEDEGWYDTLLDCSGYFSFQSNGDSNNDNVHYTPIWFKDGKYVFSLIYEDFWTPAGVIRACRNYTINIDGNVYDDWYVGR